MFDAYANDNTVLNIQGDDLIIANGMKRVTISGTLVIAKDQYGLKAAYALQNAINSIVAALQSEASLPKRLDDAPPAPEGCIDNPFA